MIHQRKRLRSEKNYQTKAQIMVISLHLSSEKRAGKPPDNTFLTGDRGCRKNRRIFWEAIHPFSFEMWGASVSKAPENIASTAPRRFRWETLKSKKKLKLLKKLSKYLKYGEKRKRFFRTNVSPQILGAPPTEPTEWMQYHAGSVVRCNLWSVPKKSQTVGFCLAGENWNAWAILRETAKKMTKNVSQGEKRNFKKKLRM